MRASTCARPPLNGFTLLVLIVLMAGIPIAFRAGMLREQRNARMRNGSTLTRAVAERDGDALPAAPPDAPDVLPEQSPQPPFAPMNVALVDERARLIRVAEGENSALRRARLADTAEVGQLREFAEDRRALLRGLADARTETARYREIVVDLEDNAPPLLLDAPNAPDDLKLIVGVGPVLERMLQRLGIGTYRQIARWSDHDIDTFDARLPEFRGRIRRDGWVTQARSLHQSKYGERPY